MIGQLVAHGHGIAMWVLAELASDQSVSLLRQLEPRQRVRVMAGLAIILTFGGFLLLFVRASGRFARGYVNRPQRVPRLPGTPVAAPRNDVDSPHQPDNGPIPPPQALPWDA